MADELVGRTVQIFSIDGDLPIGVNHTKPAFQVVYAGAPVNNWRFERAEDEAIYRLSIGGYQFVGVNENGDVVASIYPDNPVPVNWRIVRSQGRDAYTIELADRIRPARVWSTTGDGKPIRIRASEFPGILPGELFMLRLSE